jgi:tetratricopeptide (TPR) repeat protein
MWAALCLFGAVILFLKHDQGRLVGGIIATIGLSFSLPVFAAGATIQAFILAGACIALLYLLWDSAWNDLIPAGLVMALVSLSIGFFYAYLHAATLRSNFIRPAAVTADMPIVERRVLEVLQSIDVLSTFYIFVFLLLIVLGLALAWSKISQAQKMGSWPGFIATLILIPVAVFVIGTTNVQVIHADILYKRGEPFDNQAGRNGDIEAWDTAIAIYEKALDFAPTEDFYYLMLGRAYLERASLTDDQQEREALLNDAEVRLLEAQKINPLNTDHTANLARLNTRRADTQDQEEKAERLEIASDFYDKAMSLSPQNAVINNEYARLALALERNCDRGIELYNRSAEKDPFYSVTFFDRAQALMDCAKELPEEEREEQYILAVDSAEKGLQNAEKDPRGWLLLAENQVMLGKIEDALVSYETAVDNSNRQYQPWRIDLIMAERMTAVEELARAIELAESALGRAPDNRIQQIQEYLSGLQSVGEGAS